MLITMQNETTLVALAALPKENDAQFSFATRLAAIADDFIIDSPEMYELGAAELSDYKRLHDEIDARRRSITEPLNTALDNANALFKPVLSKLASASALLRTRMAEWAGRERARIANENAARERVIRAERERLEAEAKAASSKGNAEEAFALRATASIMTAPVQAVAAPKLAGVSSRSNWSAECLDLAELVQFVAANPQYLNYLQANQPALTSAAKAQKAALKIPGVRVWDKGTMAVRLK